MSFTSLALAGGFFTTNATWEAPKLKATRKERGKDKLGVGIDIYTLIYIKQITNKNLLYSTGHFTQHSVMTSMGKESKKEWIYVYV